MRYYVKLKDGVVLSEPRVVSVNPHDSPNTNWSYQQMKLNGYCYVDLSAADDEYRYISDPIVSGYSESYPLLK